MTFVGKGKGEEKFLVPNHEINNNNSERVWRPGVIPSVFQTNQVKLRTKNGKRTSPRVHYHRRRGIRKYLNRKKNIIKRPRRFNNVVQLKDGI